jgi:hypothetical protein
MKIKCFVLVLLLLVGTLYSQVWKVTVYVKGDLPYTTDIYEFQSDVESAIEANADNPTYTFNIRVIASQDTVIYSAILKIKGDVKEGKVLKTFENAINTFFSGKFENGYIKTEYLMEREW